MSLQRLLLVAAVVVAAAPALGAGIDLTKPYGNKSGCINRNGQQVYAEDMLLVTKTDLVTAASACTIKETKQNSDGSVGLKTECETEGEEGKVPADFVLKPSPKNKKKLIVTNDSGFVMGEVSQCK